MAANATKGVAKSVARIENCTFKLDILLNAAGDAPITKTFSFLASTRALVAPFSLYAVPKQCQILPN